MPADKEYNWGSLDNCALCQYLNARDFTIEGNYWHIAQTLKMETVACDGPQTFGAMLDRARAALPH